MRGSFAQLLDFGSYTSCARNTPPNSSTQPSPPSMCTLPSIASAPVPLLAVGVGRRVARVVVAMSERSFLDTFGDHPFQKPEATPPPTAEVAPSPLATLR